MSLIQNGGNPTRVGVWFLQKKKHTDFYGNLGKSLLRGPKVTKGIEPVFVLDFSLSTKFISHLLEEKENISVDPSYLFTFFAKVFDSSAM